MTKEALEKANKLTYERSNLERNIKAVEEAKAKKARLGVYLEGGIVDSINIDFFGHIVPYIKEAMQNRIAAIDAEIDAL